MGFTPNSIPRISRVSSLGPAGANILQQQTKFDAFLEEFNHATP
jgi:hypothetical protein